MNSSAASTLKKILRIWLAGISNLAVNQDKIIIHLDPAQIVQSKKRYIDVLTIPMIT